MLLPDYSQGGHGPRCMPVLHADQMQLLKAEQALAAAANGTAIARAVVVRASGDTGGGANVNVAAHTYRVHVG